MPPEAPLSPGPPSLALFCLLGIALCTIACWIPESCLAPFNHLTALSTVQLLGLFGQAPELSGVILRQDTFSIVIIGECTVLFMLILYGSFVVSCNAPISYKAAGLLLGASLLHAANVARIALIFAVGIGMPALFETVHAYLGQVAMIIIVCGACLLWQQWLTDGAVGPWWFMARVVAWSGIPFLAWLHLNQEYVYLSDGLLSFLSGLAGYQLMFSHEHELYFHTFNLVTYTALVLATRGTPLHLRLLAIIAGLPLLALGHLLLRAGNVAFSAFGHDSAFQLANAASLAGQYVAPMALWFLFVARRTREKTGVDTGKKCEASP